MYSQELEKKAASQAINRTLKMIEEEFEIEVDKEDKYPPTRRREITIERLKDEIDKFTEQVVIKWYKVGARRGALEILRVLIDKNVIDDDEYKKFIEDFDKLEWNSSLNYTKYDGDKAKTERMKFSIDFQKILKRLDK